MKADRTSKTSPGYVITSDCRGVGRSTRYSGIQISHERKVVISGYHYERRHPDSLRARDCCTSINRFVQSRCIRRAHNTDDNNSIITTDIISWWQSEPRVFYNDFSNTKHSNRESIKTQVFNKQTTPIVFFHTAHMPTTKARPRLLGVRNELCEKCTSSI